MNIILDSISVALNDLIAACIEAAELYDTAAANAEHEEAATAFRSLAAVRRRAADDLGELVRRRGDLPVADPNDERVVFEKAITALKSMFAFNPDDQLLEDCKGKEAKIAEAAEALLDLDAGEEAHTIARRLHDDATAHT